MSASWEFLQVYWVNLVDRTTGPMSFRVYLQPSMALLAALRQGIRDARLGQSPYLMRLVFSTHAERRQLLHESIVATRRVLLVGVLMDVIYQFTLFGTLKYPVETVVVSVLLAFIPYLIMRGPITRLARRWMARKPTVRP